MHSLVFDWPLRAWDKEAVLDGSLAENGGHSHVLAQGKVLPGCCGHCARAWLYLVKHRFSFGGDVASVAFAGRAPTRPDDTFELKAGWSSAISSERPSRENEALPLASRASGWQAYRRPSETLT